MLLDRYQLVTQIHAGPDGAVYRATARSDGSPCEVRLLARDGPAGATAIVKRLQLAALVDHAAARRIIELSLDDDPPAIVMEPLDAAPLREYASSRLPISIADAARFGRDVAAALAAAHRIGLIHACLSPDSIRVTPQGQPRLDFTVFGTDLTLRLASHGAVAQVARAADVATTRIGPAEPAAPLAPLPADSRLLSADPADDVRALGTVLEWLLGSNVAAAPEMANLIRAMLASDSADRPTARDVADQLQAIAAPVASTGDFTAEVHSPAASPANSFGSGSVVHLTAAMPQSAIARAVADVVAAPASHAGSATDSPPRERLGRFRLLEKLGEGGMGAVYRAEDVSDGSVVALKLLRPQFVAQPEMMRRFHKEARLLAEVNNPYVANLIEVNEDNGIHFLAIEFVAGRSLERLIEVRGSLDERLALATIADVCRALIDAHRRGIVHRDIKPANILMAEGSRQLAVGSREEDAASTPQSLLPTAYSLLPKLTDFGLARHVVESESLAMTRAGAVLGTPLYMAPEQFAGTGEIDPRTDVYALGATLFHLLAGRPPFVADTPLALMKMHSSDPPPSLKKLKAETSDGATQIVEKALAKHPDSRYADAAAMLADIERLLRGEPTSIVIHPRLPACDSAKVLQYEVRLELDSPPEQIWPHVSNTERLNRAVGLTAPRFTTEPDETGRVRRRGAFRTKGVAVAWEEHPFEWIEARRMGVLREFSAGPFKWLISAVELAPRPGGGTSLVHRITIEPRNFLGRTIAAVEVGVRSRKSLERVYRRIDAAMSGKLGPRASVDPFEPPAALPTNRRERLDHLLEVLDARGVDPAVVERLGDFISEAPPQEVTRIRPLALARRFDLDANQVVAACLHGAREGLFALVWDILCPVCRIPSEVKETLRQLREHGRCEACNIDFELDFANSIELVFRVHPEIRAAELGTFCIGGPAHSPHVVAQVRIAPRERIELELAMTEGAYRLRGPQLPRSVEFRVEPQTVPTRWRPREKGDSPLATTDFRQETRWVEGGLSPFSLGRWDVELARLGDAAPPRGLKAGRQMIALANDFDAELIVRIERTAPRDDALTAARASSLGLFRELFPGEVLAPGQLVSVANVTLLVTALDGAADLYASLGDVKAFEIIHEHFRRLDERIRREGGALVKTIGEGVLAAFVDPAAAVRVALDLNSTLPTRSLAQPLRLRAAVHRGTAMVATLNDHLDYFGTTTNAAFELLGDARASELLLSHPASLEPSIVETLSSRGVRPEVLDRSIPGQGRAIAMHIVLGS